MQLNEKILPYKTYRFIYNTSNLSFAIKADFKIELTQELGLYAYFIKAERGFFGVGGIEVIFTPNKENGTVTTWSESIRKILEKYVYGDLYLYDSEIYQDTSFTGNIKETISESVKGIGNYLILIISLSLFLYMLINKKER